MKMYFILEFYCAKSRNAIFAKSQFHGQLALIRNYDFILKFSSIFTFIFIFSPVSVKDLYLFPDSPTSGVTKAHFCQNNEPNRIVDRRTVLLFTIFECDYQSTIVYQRGLNSSRFLSFSFPLLPSL